jgi:hypothetical protein
MRENKPFIQNKIAAVNNYEFYHALGEQNADYIAEPIREKVDCEEKGYADGKHNQHHDFDIYKYSVFFTEKQPLQSQPVIPPLYYVMKA